MVLNTEDRDKELEVKSLWNTIVDYVSSDAQLLNNLKALKNETLTQAGILNSSDANLNETSLNGTNAGDGKFFLFLEKLFHLSKAASLAIFCAVCLGVLIIFILLIYCLCCRKRDLKMKRGFEPLNYADFPDLSGGKLRTEALYGRIEYSIEYKSKKQELRIGIIQAKDMPCSRGVVFNPYTNFTLIKTEPQEDPKKKPKTIRKEKRTKTIQKCNNPCWNEYFTFKVGNREIQSHSLRFEVLDSDEIGMDRKLGQLEISFEDINLQLFMDKTYECTTPLDKGDDLVVGSGDACIILKYHKPTASLQVTLLEIKRLQLDVKKIGRKPDLVATISCHYAKKHVGKSITKVKSFSANPYFDETASFHLTEDKLRFCQVHVKVHYVGLIPSYKTCFGKVTLGMGSKYRACLMHWKDMMSDYKRSAAFWHILRYPNDDDYDDSQI